MKKPNLPLPLDLIRARLRIDAEGVLRWRERPASDFPAPQYALTWNAKNTGREAGGEKGRGYRMVRIDRVAYLYHRIVFALTYGCDPGASLVDHKDGDTTHSAGANLQATSNTNNVRKRRGPGRNNTSGVLGVSWSKAARKWAAKIKVGRTEMHLGLFTDISDAKTARETASLKYFGAFAPLTHERNDHVAMAD